jgi:aspartyl protease family protein
VKTIFKLMLLSTLFNLIPLAATAQTQSECIVLDAQGKPMNLGHLCGGGVIPSSNKNPSITTSPSNPGVFTAKIKRREFGIPVIEVQFNNQHTFEMLVDTGASLTILTERMAQQLQIQPIGNMLLYTANDSVYVPRSRVASVAAGGIKSQNLDVAIAPSLDLGLLGQNFFGHYDITIKQDVIEFRAR